MNPLKTLTSAQKLHCRTKIFDERLLMNALALKDDHDIIMITRKATGIKSLRLI